MLTISSCVIVRDEERNLPRYLECVKRLADEIIVVDTGSVDHTVKIAESAGAAVHYFSWCDDFAAARNFAIEQAHGDWIVFLDADEYFTYKDCAKVRQYIMQFDRQQDVLGLMCRCVNIDEDNGCCVKNEFQQVRLFRRIPGLRYYGAIHEVLRYIHPQGVEVRPRRMQVVPELAFYHTGYSSGKLANKLQRNLRMLKQKETRGELQLKDSYFLADCYYGLGDFAKAAEYAEQAARSGLDFVGANEIPCRTWVKSLMALERPKEEVQAVLQEVRSRFPHDEVLVDLAVQAECIGNIRQGMAQTDGLFVSACVIVKNEEKNLPAWLSCMKKLADELIVVDTGSNDGTVALAEEAGARVFSFRWRNDFAAAKNYALEQAKGNWILFLDADEVFLSEDCARFYQQLVRFHRERKVLGISSRRQDYDEDAGHKYMGDVLVVRAFRNLATLCFRGCVHETLVNEDKSNDYEMPFLSFPAIQHTGYSASISREKGRRNLDLLLQKQRLKGTLTGNDYLYLADCYYGLEQYQEAVQAARLAIQEGVSLEGMETRPRLVLLQSMLFLHAPGKELEAALQEAQTSFPDNMAFVFLEGIYWQNQGQRARAAECYMRGLSAWERQEAGRTKASVYISDDAGPMVPQIKGRLAECL